MAAEGKIDNVALTVFVPPPIPINSQADTIVEQGWANAQQYASSAVSSALGFLDKIQGVAEQVTKAPSVNDALGPVTQVIDAFQKPTLPNTPNDLTLKLPNAPNDPVLISVSTIDMSGLPTFTATLPTINLDIAVPAPLNATPPVAPITTSVVIPTAPSVTLPSVPSLIGITVPTAQLLNIPTFSVVPPTGPNAPGMSFAFTESTYNSSLLRDLRNTLDSWINGASTGLNPLVEQAIWERGRAREIVQSGQQAKEAMRKFAARGFAKPPGALSIEIQAAVQATQDTVNTQSRDVAIKQADLEQTNRRFAFDQSWKIEEGLITYANQIAQRSFDAAKYAQQAAIDIYQQMIAEYSASVQKFNSQVEQWKAAIQAELSKLEIFKSQIEAEKLIGEINLQSVEIYKTKTESARLAVDVFRAQVDAANSEAMINKTLIEGYAAQTQAYGEQVRAKASEYDAYATQIRAQVSKADVFRAQADAFTSQVGGFRALKEVQIAQANINLKIGQEVPVEVFKARSEAYRDQVEAETSRVKTIADVFNSQIQAFTAQNQGESGRMSAEASAYRAEADVLTSAANVRIEVVKANIQTLVQQVTLLLDAIKSGATVSSQLAASALSAVHLSGGISNSVSTSSSTSVSGSVSQSKNYSESFTNTYSPAN